MGISYMYLASRAAVDLTDKSDEALMVRTAHAEVYSRRFFVMAMPTIVSAAGADMIWAMQYVKKQVPWPRIRIRLHRCV